MTSFALRPPFFFLGKLLRFGLVAGLRAQADGMRAQLKYELRPVLNPRRLPRLPTSALSHPCADVNQPNPQRCDAMV